MDPKINWKKYEEGHGEVEAHFAFVEGSSAKWDAKIALLGRWRASFPYPNPEYRRFNLLEDAKEWCEEKLRRRFNGEAM